ncbi:MAG TPA: S1 family peptidase [Polyangiaceae bacterium]
MDHQRKSGERWRKPATRLALLGAAWGALATAACAADRPEHASGAAQSITGGNFDLSHSNVFLLAARDGDRVGLCTATLLAPNLLLTARHCVSPSSHEVVRCGRAALGEPFPASAFFATNDAEPSDDSRVFKALAVEVPGEGADTCGYDIALVVLSEGVPAEVAVPAVPRIDRAVAPGETYTAVGYGVDAAGETSGRRMQLGGLLVSCEPGACDATVIKATEFLGDSGVCSGDSGGPALDEDDKVVGVVSRGGPDCTTPIYGSITGWSDFIIRVASQAAELGGYEAPFWVTSGSSEPPALGAPSEPRLRDSSCALGLGARTPSAAHAWWLLAALAVLVRRRH